MNKPKLRITEISSTYWAFLDYGGGEFELMESRMMIHYRSEHKDFEIIHAFPYTNEKGIAGEIEELKLALEAIKILKKEKNEKA